MRTGQLPVQAGILAALTLFAACGGGGTDGELASAGHTGSLIVSEKVRFSLDTLHTGLENPWGMTWLPDGRMLVTERNGELMAFEGHLYSGDTLTGCQEA